MERKNDYGTRLLLSLLFIFHSILLFSQSSYPVHVSVQALPPYSIYLTDYYSGSRDRLIVTLLNRDKQQRTLKVKLRMRIRNGSSFNLQSRDELYYPMLTLESGIPLRLTGADLAAYLSPDKITMQGRLNQGKLPTGMTEFSVQAVDYVTGRTLSDFGTGRVWLETKQPPTLNLPLKDEQVAYRDPQHIRFQWMPRHQGLANTQYEFTLKMLPDNGAAPQSAFAYGQQMYRTVTRFTTLNYTHLEPLLIPGKRYAWQVRAIAKDGIDEIGMFENNGYSEIAWFELNDNCPAVTQVSAEGGFRKMTVKWKGMPQQRAFLVEYRPKSARNSYDWISTRTFDTSLLIPDLKAGWTYEYRVGALCMTEKPVYSEVKEITLSQNNEAIMQNCGVAPVIDLSNQTPKEDLKVGDVVIVGGDHPMTITELSSQGNGWYSGRGKMHLAWIFDLNIAMKFNHLRINTDNRQIDGTAESETDPNAAKIANTNELDYGGKRTTAGKVEFAVKKLEFTVPETPTAQYNPETEELIVFDTEGKPHAIETKKNEGGSIFPMMIEDEQGNKYQIDAPATPENPQPGDNDMAATGGATQQPVITKIEDASSGFNPEVVATGADFSVRFLPGSGKYAFDAGREPWYQTAQLIKQHYLPLENGYIAPWKLIPVGESDVVEAAIEGSGAEKKKIKFVLKDGKGLPAREENGVWTLTLPSVKAGETYEVFAVYEEKKGKTTVVGKLNVVSYPKQKHTVTLVPVEAATPDITWLETELNRIYTPYGVTITIKVDDSLKDNKEWDLDGDGALNLNGSGFFSKETDEMKALRKLYQRTSPRYDRNAYYIFLTDRAKAGEEPDAGLAVQGDMPRGKQFGYIFMQNAANTPRLIAHELGHGIFTLRHTFEVNYSGDKFKAATPNLMDYNNGTELTVWQWSVMANPAPLTWFDSEDDAKSVETIFLASGQNAGITPNGVVINSFRSAKEEYKVVHGIKEGSFSIHAFHLYDRSGKAIKSYTWNAAKNDYLDKAQNSIKNDKDIIVTYNAANALVDATIYKTGNRCFYYYAKVKHTSGLKTIQEPAPGEWKASYLFDASDDCKNQLAREDILKRDREGCDDLPTAIKTIKEAVGIEEPQKVVTIVNSVCLDALKELSYEEIIKLIKVIAKQPKLKEDSELAIIRLINAINSNKYGDFFRVLEENQNELIKYLVDQIDDASLCFWYDNNYTNFMGALVKMCQSQTASYLNRIPEAGDEKLLGQVLNVYNQPFKNDLPATGIITGVVSMNEFTFCGIYDKDRGTIDIERKKLVINPAVTGSDVDNRPQPEVKGTIVATGLSPLTPIIYTAENELPLVATALDMPADTKAHQYIVPAIFLKYKGTKEFNDAAERSGMIVLDAVTIAASGSAALATKVNWVKRIWALSEVVGAVGNIGVNTQTVTDPNLIEAINIYNGAMGVIGLKNSAKGLIGFTNGLPDATKTLLAQGQTLKSTLSKGHAAWQSAVSKLTSITANERKILEKQMWGWRVSLHLLPDDAWFYNPNMSDRVRQIVANSGEGMGKFVNINYWASRGAASKEDITWLQNFVTKHFPAPKEGDVLRKVIDLETMKKWHLGENNVDFIKPSLREDGFITKIDNYVIPNSAEELIENLRLDYKGSPFSKNKGFAVIEFKYKTEFNIDHPFNTAARNSDLPYTNTGMTGAKHNIIPEYVNQKRVTFSEGDEMKIFDKYGKILETYKYLKNNEETGKIIERWIKQ